MNLTQEHIDGIIDLTINVGKDLTQYYHSSNLHVEYKSDNSPVTAGDRHAHDVITQYLFRLFPDIPIVSEEGDDSENAMTVRTHATYWLIDPIDGTASFIDKIGDFTINIALIVEHKPTFGIIYQPITDTLYYTANDKAYKVNQRSAPSVISVNRDVDVNRGIKLVSSTKFFSKKARQFADRLNVVQNDHVSSSLKFCLVAEGKYDAYFHFSSAMCMWDIAAGHAILLKAGGLIYDVAATQNKILSYGNRPLKVFTLFH